MPLSAAMVRMRSPVVGSRSDAAVRTFEGANARLLVGAAIWAGGSGRMGSPERSGGLGVGGRGDRSPAGGGWSCLMPGIFTPVRARPEARMVSAPAAASAQQRLKKADRRPAVPPAVEVLGEPG